MPFDVAPNLVKINYTTTWAPHTASIPTLEWTNVPSTNDKGRFATHNGGDIDAVDMIEALANALAGFQPATCTFDNWIIYAKTEGDSPLLPVASGVFDTLVGDSGETGWAKAMQRTITYRTGGFNLFKIVALDAPHSNLWDKVVTPDAAIDALTAEVADLDKGWAGRDNNPPETFVSCTFTMNEKLRRAYRMT